jgi:hypothetical protein
MNVPNPGSDEAVGEGCTCAVLDNRHGAGIPYGEETCWCVNGDCPLHGEVKMGNHPSDITEGRG